MKKTVLVKLSLPALLLVVLSSCKVPSNENTENCNVTGTGDGADAGANWTTVDNPFNESFLSLSYNCKDTIVAVGDKGKIVTSSDGLIWEERVENGDRLNSVAYGNNQFVAVGDKNTIMTSTDGINWNDVTFNGPDTLYGITFGRNLFVIVGINSMTTPSKPAILTSKDGQTWDTQEINTNVSLLDVTYANGLFIAVGDSGFVFSSPDGKVWSQRSEREINSTLFSVAYGNNVYVAVSASGDGLRSRDGESWEKIVLAANPQVAIRDIAYERSTFVAVGAMGTILTSPDGENWMSRTSGTMEDLLSVIYAKDKFIVTGLNGTILTSP